MSAAVVRRALLVAALYAGPLLILIVLPIEDADVWWHLRTGAWVAEHRAVPTTDPFSTYGAGRPWIAYSWLFELGLHGLYEAAGLTGIVAGRVVLGLVALAATHGLVARREPRFLVATAVTALAFVALWPMMRERPWLLSLIGTALTLDAVLRLRDGTAPWRDWVLLPCVYALWANGHIQFVYGLAVFGAAVVGALIDRVRGFPYEDARWKEVAGLALVCAAATLVNPYGVGVYRVVLGFAGQPVAYRLIRELNSLEFDAPFDWAVLTLFALAAFALGRRRRVSAFDLLLLAGTASVSFRSRRDLWYVVLAALTVLASASREQVTNAIPERGGRLLTMLLLAFFGAVTAFFGQSEERLQEAVRRAFPEEACAYIERNDLRGPLYSDFDVGGFLIWRLPWLPPQIDNRMNVHGDARISRHADTRRGIAWRDDAELLAARLVLVKTQGPLPELLAASGRYRIVYQDDQATVLVAP